jgi:HD-GYP domain-containing protein (c-di-GMP phosphodiesterase class II)
VIPIIFYHHEKYNGTGYPSGLKKEQIPLGARIMAVADAFEAMVYGRPYRERMDITSATKEIKKKSGTQFDPKIVEAFLKVVKKINTKKYLQLNQ